MREILRAPLTWVVAICVAAIFASLSWLGGELRAQNRAVAAKFTEDLASSVNAQVFERYSDSQALAMNPAILDLLVTRTPRTERSAGAVLEEFIRLYAVYSKVVVSDAAGNVLITRADHGPVDIPARRQFAEADSRYPTNISTPIDSPKAGREFQIYRSAIRDGGGKLRGWVENVASTLYLERELTRTRRLSIWGAEIPLRVHVLDEHGGRVASMVDGEITYPPHRPAGVPSWEVGRIARFTSDINDPRLENPLNWNITFEIPEAKLFESVLQIERILYVINCVIIVAGLLTAGWIQRARRRHEREITELVLSAQEAEKARISREIHDDVGQNLSAAKLWLARIQDGIAPEKRGIYGEIKEIIESTNDSLRRISLALHPSLLNNLGLEASIRWKLESAAKASRFEGLYVNEDAVPLDRLPLNAQIHVFRFVQEAIQNIQKHAGAAHVVVRACAERDRLVVSVADDGQGLRGNRKGIGFHSMDERAKALDGRVRVESPLSERVRSESGFDAERPGTSVQLEFAKRDLEKGDIREIDINC